MTVERDFVAWTSSLVKSGKSFSNHDTPMTIPVAKSFLLCPKLRKCMIYLMDHVKPLEDRQRILLNLQHARLYKSSKTSENLPKNSLALKFDDALQQNQQASVELQNASWQRDRVFHKETNLHLQKTFLMAIVMTQQAELDMLKRCSARICASSKKLDFQSEKEQESLIHDMLTGILKDMVKTRMTLLNASQDSDKINCQELPACVWTSLDKLLKAYPLKCVVEGIIRLTRQNAEEIQKQTSQINLLKDAQELSASCEEGCVKSVQKLLVAMCGRHVENKMTCAAMKTRDKPLIEAQKEFESHVHDAIKEATKDENIQEWLGRYYSQIVKEASCQAQLKELQNIGLQMNQRTKEENKRTDSLMQSHKTIHDNDAQLELLKSQMKSLVVASTQRIVAISKCCEQHEELVDQKLSSVNSDTATPSASRELSVCVETPVAALQKICGQTHTLDLGPLSSTVEPETQVMTSRLRHVIDRLPCVTDVLSKRRGEVEILHKYNEQQKKDSSDMKAQIKKSNVISAEHAKATYGKTKDFNRNLENKISPLVDSCEKNLRRTQNKLQLVKKSIDTWWTQPVKNIDLQS